MKRGGQINDFVNDGQRRFWIKYCDDNRRVMTSVDYRLVKAAFLTGWAAGYQEGYTDADNGYDDKYYAGDE